MTEKIKNTTPTTWQTSNGYTLQSARPAGNTTWSVEFQLRFADVGRAGRNGDGRVLVARPDHLRFCQKYRHYG